MTEHLITIDTDDDGNGRDVRHKAFCDGEGCGWGADAWHHADQQAGFDPADVDTFADASNAAYLAAVDDGLAHLHEASGELPVSGLGALSSMPVPVAGPDGYAAGSSGC